MVSFTSSSNTCFDNLNVALYPSLKQNIMQSRYSLKSIVVNFANYGPHNNVKSNTKIRLSNFSKILKVNVKPLHFNPQIHMSQFLFLKGFSIHEVPSSQVLEINFRYQNTNMALISPSCFISHVVQTSHAFFVLNNCCGIYALILIMEIILKYSSFRVLTIQWMFYIML